MQNAKQLYFCPTCKYRQPETFLRLSIPRCNEYWCVLYCVKPRGMVENGHSCGHYRGLDKKEGLTR